MALFNKQKPLFGKQKAKPMKEPEYKQAQKRPNSKNLIGAAIIIVVVVVAAYYLVFLNVNQQVVATPAVVNVTQAGTIFSINGQQYLISLSSISIGNGRAYIHISKLPIFVNPLLNVTLTLGNITKVNAGTSFANVGIQLQSISANDITIKVSPLFTSLQIPPDSQYIRVVQSTLYNAGQTPGGSGSSGSTITTTAGTTTTVLGASTTSASTTVQPTNKTPGEISTALKQNPLYGLMLNFSVLYANTSSCTAALYNSAYIYANGHAPSAPNSYYNVTPFVPYNMSSITTNIGGGNFKVVFTTKTIDPNFNNAIAATITVNASAKITLNQSFGSTGIFSDLSLTQVRANYVRAIATGGPCGVEV